MGLLLLPRLFGFIFRPISMLMRGDFRGLFSLLLGFAVLGALWETALFGISTQTAATTIMTDAGVAIVNPILENASLGLVQGPAFQALQAGAALSPSEPVTIPGLKVTILGSDIAGKSFTDASRAVYAKVATAYYDGGASAVLDVPGPVAQAVNVGLAPAGWLSWASFIGLTPSALTASGHAQAQTLMLWLWIASAVLGLLVVALNKGWARLYALAHGLFTGAVPGLVVLGVAWLAASRIPNVFGSFTTLFGDFGAVLAPVYIGAGVAAVALVVVGMIGNAATKGAQMASSARRRTPAPVGARVQQPARPAYPSYDAQPGYRPSPNANPGGANPAPSYGQTPSYGESPAYDQSPSYGSQWPQYGQTQPYGQSSSYGQGGGYDQGSSYGSSGQGYDQGQSAWQPGSTDAMWLGDTTAFPPRTPYRQDYDPPASPGFPPNRR